MTRAIDLFRKHWLWIGVNVAASIPLILLAWDFAMNNLGINPIDEITEQTGKAAIILLIASLAVTPINIIFGYRPVIKVRKSSGLFAFFYVSLHLLTFVGLDYAFSLDFILRDGLPQKPYIVAGFAAFLILVPLAVTSTKGWMRRLGRNWKRLHNWVYLAGILAVLHYVWVAKADLGDPLFYAALLTFFLAVRVPRVRKAITRTRQKWTKPSPSRPEISRQEVRAKA